MNHLEGCTVVVQAKVSLVPGLTQLLSSGRLELSTPTQSGSFEPAKLTIKLSVEKGRGV